MRKDIRKKRNNNRKNNKGKPKSDILESIIIKAESSRKLKKKSVIAQLKAVNVSSQEDKDSVIKHPQKDSENIPKDIQDPFVAFYDDDTREPIDFDTALERVKQNRTLTEREEIVYIGKGEFAVVTYSGKKNKMEIKERIPVETHREDLKWREELCFDLSLSYKPNPEPLSKLYSAEEKEKFTRFR